MKREASKSEYIQNPYVKQVEDQWLILGKFRTAKEVDRYFKELIDEYTVLRSPFYTFNTVYKKVTEDGITIPKTHLRKLFYQAGVYFKKDSQAKPRKTNQFTITLPNNVLNFLDNLGGGKKAFLVDMIKIIGNLPTQSMIIIIPGGKRAMLHKSEDGKMRLLILTDLTSAELSIIQRIAAKGYKYNEIELIKNEFCSYPGWHVIGGTLNPQADAIPKHNTGEKIEFKFEWPTENDLLNPDGTILP